MIEKQFNGFCNETNALTPFGQRIISCRNDDDAQLFGAILADDDEEGVGLR